MYTRVHILFPSRLAKRPENSDTQYDEHNAQIWDLSIIFYIRRNRALGTEPIPGLRQGSWKVNLEHRVRVLKGWRGHTKARGSVKAPQRPSLNPREHQKT